MIKDRKQEISQRILRIASLEPGWHFGRGEKVSAGVLKSLSDAADAACGFGFATIDVVPGADGEAQMVVSEGANEIELTIEPDGTATLVVEREGHPTASISAVTIPEAMRQFRDYSSQICSGSSVSSIRFNFWKKGGNSQVLHFTIAPQGEFRSLTRNALPNSQALFASTLKAFTQRRQEFLESIGDSTKPRFQSKRDSNPTTRAETTATTTCLA